MQFSGNAYTRRTVAILMLAAQGGVVQPISIMFGGTGGYEEISKRTIYVSGGLDGIVCGTDNGQITIPTYGGNWGSYSIFMLYDGLSVYAI